MTLHESRQDPALPLELGDDRCPESLASALSRINYIARRFNEKIDQVDFESISPFPPRSLYKGAAIQYRLWKETGDRKWLETSEEMKLMLTHFSKRWMNAGRVPVRKKWVQANIKKQNYWIKLKMIANHTDFYHRKMGKIITNHSLHLRRIYESLTRDKSSAAS